LIGVDRIDEPGRRRGGRHQCRHIRVGEHLVDAFLAGQGIPDPAAPQLGRVCAQGPLQGGRAGFVPPDVQQVFSLVRH
jgi:hypothetical protein